MSQDELSLQDCSEFAYTDHNEEVNSHRWIALPVVGVGWFSWINDDVESKGQNQVHDGIGDESDETYDDSLVFVKAVGGEKLVKDAKKREAVLVNVDVYH